MWQTGSDLKINDQNPQEAFEILRDWIIKWMMKVNLINKYSATIFSKRHQNTYRKRSAANTEKNRMKENREKDAFQEY